MIGHNGQNAFLLTLIDSLGLCQTSLRVVECILDINVGIGQTREAKHCTADSRNFPSPFSADSQNERWFATAGDTLQMLQAAGWLHHTWYPLVI